MKFEMRIKNSVKYFLIKTKLWYMLDSLRKFPNILYYFNSGCHGVSPDLLKMRIVKSYLKQFSMNIFIESGTYLGDTCNYIAESGVRCISIELSEQLYREVTKRFRSYKNVELILGDSSMELSKLLAKIKEPALFWLDGHYSAGITACAGKFTPISDELEAIFNHSITQHVILIDDARCFNGTNGYPHLDDLLHMIRKKSKYKVEVSMDIIRLTPYS